MIQFRKILIGMFAAGAVVLAFVIYTNMGKGTEILQPQSRNEDVLERPDFSSSSKFDSSGVGGVDNAEFFTRDEVTKKISRIFGFEKLLNPEANSEKWRLQKPYMQFFGDEFECKIFSDEGNFQIEKVMGVISPQNARLYGNVKLEITFQNEGVPTNGVIYLEDLDYDSERSELATDKSVKAVFDEAVMEGTGMILIYNSALGRIEYFEMKDLDFIRIKNLAMMSEDRKGEKGVKGGEVVKVGDTSNGLKVAGGDGSGGAKVDLVVVAGAVAETDAQMVADEKGDYYHCSFLKDVIIEYGNELVVKSFEELNIKNLIFSQGGNKQESSNKPTGVADSDKAESIDAVAGSPVSNEHAGVLDSDKAESKDVVVADGGAVNVAALDAGSEKTADTSTETTEVVLTCKEGFVLQLMSNVKSDTPRGGPVVKSLSDTLYTLLDEAGNAEVENDSVNDGLIFADGSAGFAGLPLGVGYANFAAADDAGQFDGDAVIVAKPTRFHATKIDYDMSAKYAYAAGPINLLIYDPNADAGQEQVPINITAMDNAEYFGDRGQIVFNGEVVGSRKIADVDYVTENSVHGDQLFVDLESGADENSIRHISVVGKNVMLFSERKADEEVLSLVRLKCLRIDYDATDEFVEAMGPGVIEVDNSKVPVDADPGAEVIANSEDTASSEENATSEITLKEPCYAIIDDFDSLKWYTVTNKLVVDGSSDSVKIQHIPVVNGQFGKITYVAARNIEAKYKTTSDGRSELVALTASDTVSFMEKDGDVVLNNFIGDNLFYDATKSNILITGTEGNPCLANGFNTDKISYNLATGELVTGISGPATIQLPPEPKR